MNKLLKIWIAFLASIAIGIVVTTKATITDILPFIGLAIGITLVAFTIKFGIYWVIENIIDRHRYHITDPDKDGGCYRVDRKFGSVEYILPKTGCLSPKVQGEIAADEERMYRENS